MLNFLEKFDSLAGLTSENRLALWLERFAFGSLLLMVLSAPHSIAATQISWLLGMVFWIARYFVSPRPKFVKTALFYPLLVFFGWTVITAIFSYAPDISIDKLRGASLFTIFFFTVNNLRTIKSVKFMAFVLIASCIVVAIWTPIERAIGRGIEIIEFEDKSILAIAGLKVGDILLSTNGKKLETPEDLGVEIEKEGKLRVLTQRYDSYWQQELWQSGLSSGDTAQEKLGIRQWKRSRNWRSSGFYGHYATFAEVLQLIGSLVLGLFIASLGRKAHYPPVIRDAQANGGQAIGSSDIAPNKSALRRLAPVVGLFIVTALISLSLLLTVTRAPQIAFVISTICIVLLGSNKKVILCFGLVVIVLTIGSLVFLKQSRNIDFFDSNDGSTAWRQTVFREGLELWTKNPRNFIVGVGMDSIKRFKEEWHLFDNGKLQTGHLHSTPLQLVVERGFPALLMWILILGTYLGTLYKALRKSEFSDWMENGIVLGCFGGIIGFFVSGWVHYNYGDGEVVMVFYLLMAFGIIVATRNSANDFSNNS